MANKIKAKAKFVARRNKLVNWETNNPVLACGEFGVVKDATDKTKRLKLGDGVTPWNELEWMGESKDNITAKIDNNVLVLEQSGQAHKAVIENNILIVN